MLKFFFFTSAGTCEKDMLILLWSLETVEIFQQSYHTTKNFQSETNFTLADIVRHSAMGQRRRPVTSLGQQVGRRVFLRRSEIFLTMNNSFKLCPTHISRRVEKNFRGASPPCATLVTGLQTSSVVFYWLVVCETL